LIILVWVVKKKDRIFFTEKPRFPLHCSTSKGYPVSKLYFEKSKWWVLYVLLYGFITIARKPHIFETVLKPTQVVWLRKLRCQVNYIEGTRQIDYVTSG